MLYAIILLLAAQLLIVTYVSVCMLLCLVVPDEDYEDMQEIAKEATIKNVGILSYVVIKAVVLGMDEVKYCVYKLSKQEAE